MIELKPGLKLAVFSVRQTKYGSSWIRTGNGFINKDGSINVYLDVLPMDGKLHCREAVVEKREPQEIPPSVSATLNGSGYSSPSAGMNPAHTDLAMADVGGNS